MARSENEQIIDPFDDLGFIPTLSVEGLKSVLLRRLNALEYFNSTAMRMRDDGTIPGDPLGHLEFADLKIAHDRTVALLDTIVPIPIDGDTKWADEIAARTSQGKDILAERRQARLGA